MEDNEWEAIQPSSSATQSDEDDADTVVVTRPTPTNITDLPIFSPNNHEGLPVLSQPIQDDHLQEPRLETPSPRSSSSFSSSPYSTEIAEEELPQRPEERNTLLNASLGILSSWVLRIAYGIRSRIGFWSIASVAALVTVTAFASRWQRWRRLAEKDETDKLLRLLNQKDEKIKQLLLQIERMNETLSGRRRIPVLRVVVDSPLVIGPRSSWKPAGQ